MRDPDEALPIGRLKRRADFLRAAKGKRWHGKALSLQAMARGDAEAHARIGFTLTRKVGGAVIRNRARRRLKEAVRLGALPVQAGHDYVVIGRIEAIRQPFEALREELARAVRGVHVGRPPRPSVKTRPSNKTRSGATSSSATSGPETASNLETVVKTDRAPGTGP